MCVDPPSDVKTSTQNLILPPNYCCQHNKWPPTSRVDIYDQWETNNKEILDSESFSKLGTKTATKSNLFSITDTDSFDVDDEGRDTKCESSGLVSSKDCVHYSTTFLGSSARIVPQSVNRLTELYISRSAELRDQTSDNMKPKKYSSKHSFLSPLFLSSENLCPKSEVNVATAFSPQKEEFIFSPLNPSKIKTSVSSLFSSTENNKQTICKSARSSNNGFTRNWKDIANSDTSGINLLSYHRNLRGNDDDSTYYREENENLNTYEMELNKISLEYQPLRSPSLVKEIASKFARDLPKDVLKAHSRCSVNNDNHTYTSAKCEAKAWPISPLASKYN